MANHSVMPFCPTNPRGKLTKVPFKTLLVRCCLIDSQPDFQGRFVTSSSILIFKMPMKVPKAALLAGRAGVSI